MGYCQRTLRSAALLVLTAWLSRETQGLSSLVDADGVAYYDAFGEGFDEDEELRILEADAIQRQKEAMEELRTTMQESHRRRLEEGSTEPPEFTDDHSWYYDHFTDDYAGNTNLTTGNVVQASNWTSSVASSGEIRRLGHPSTLEERRLQFGTQNTQCVSNPAQTYAQLSVCVNEANGRNNAVNVINILGINGQMIFETTNPTLRLRTPVIIQCITCNDQTSISSIILRRRSGALPNQQLTGRFFSVDVNNRQVEFRGIEFRQSQYDTSISDLRGGAIYIRGYGVQIITFRGCYFRNNRSPSFGGGLYIEASTADILFRSTTFEGNQALGNYGGGLAIQNARRVTIQQSRFISNRASGRGGGGLFIQNCLAPGTNQNSVIIEDTLIGYRATEALANFAQTSGGGGILSPRRGAVRLTRVDVSFNQAIFNHQGGLRVTNAALVDVAECIFLENSAGGFGGGLDIKNVRQRNDFQIINGVNVRITDSSFVGNSGGVDTAWGAGISVRDALTVQIDDTCFQNNDFTSGTVDTTGGAGFLNPINSFIFNNLVGRGNEASECDGIFIRRNSETEDECFDDFGDIGDDNCPTPDVPSN